MKRALYLLLIAFNVLVLSSSVHAGVDWQISRTFKADPPPLDIAGTIDGKHIFVLSKGGRLQVLTTAGQLLETIKVDEGMDRIDAVGLQAANLDNKIFVSSSKTGTIQEISIDFTVTINIEGSPFLGAADAPVVIVEFSDFECPYCSKVGSLFEQLLEKNPDKLKIVFKHFPLGFHKLAPSAAVASIAAHKQGKFWEFHDLLFENQKKLGRQKYLEIATKLQLDTERFTKDIADNAVRQKLALDMADGRRAGVRSTPTIFINGRRVKKRSVPDMQKIIDQELAKLGK